MNISNAKAEHPLGLSYYNKINPATDETSVRSFCIAHHERTSRTNARPNAAPDLGTMSVLC